jgi:hypothetical protein
MWNFTFRTLYHFTLRVHGLWKIYFHLCDSVSLNLKAVNLKYGISDIIEVRVNEIESERQTL